MKLEFELQVFCFGMPLWWDITSVDQVTCCCMQKT